MAIDGAGVATVVGGTWSTDFPTTPGAWDTTHNGGLGDGFVTRLDAALPSAQQVVYGTFLGGSSVDATIVVAVDGVGAATVVGWTYSFDFPTTPGAWDTTFNGGLGLADVYLSRLDLLPTGARAFGSSSAGCDGPLAIGVTSMPRLGSAAFQITCSNAPPSAGGVLLLAARGLATPFRVLGVDLWVDPAGAWFVAPPAFSSTVGAAHFALSLPPNPFLINQQVNAQFVWLGPASPPPCPRLGLSASNALEITVQP